MATAATGGYGRMTNLELLTARRYTDIEDRVGDLESVRRELQVIIDAIPTQIHPDQRTAYLNAILSDLEDREDAAWPQWPEDLHLLALTSIKHLGRNPLGSTTLYTSPSNLQTIIHHTALPFPPKASPFSHPCPPLSSPPAVEALRIMANLLVLHPKAREAFVHAGAGKALALSLAGRDAQGELILGEEIDGPERIFLLARLGFLVTMEKGEVVRTMVDSGDIVESLCYHLTQLLPIPANYNALSELLKVVMDIIRYYPSKSKSTPEAEEWNDLFDPLLQPLLNLFHALPASSLSPPLSTTLHTLLSFPFPSYLLPVWQSIPEPPSPASSSSSVRSLLNRLSTLGSPSSKRLSVSRSSSSLNINMNEESGLGLTGTTTPSRDRGRSNSSRSASSSNMSDPSPLKRRRKMVPTIMDSGAFPTKVLKVLEGWFEIYMPYPIKADEVDKNIMVDEVLPPVLLLLARSAVGSPDFRQVLKEQLLPFDLDRSPAAGPLDSRRGILGNILRLMHSSSHFSARDSAGEFLWSLCDSDPATLTSEIGYGNSAGFLFQKGIPSPPSGKISDIPTPPISSSSSSSSSSTPIPRHPISSLSEPLPQSSDVPMTPEEKLRESERLFVLFERMEKNPVIRLTPEDPENPGKSKSVREIMRDKLARGELESKGIEDEEEDRIRLEEEERRDEEEVGRDMERYRNRMRGLGREG